ncbi:hypothetical protein C6P46_001274 [Rhodotorula mucilaginosa]|uniref:Mitochondrial ATP synthase epsilon chain domain-containing protein n=1 Tax=Rhodotorula mucilaginosa TaxID=5537 RepID=A0A9P6VVH2_RHOMI|nr:hypothetical protein C6P46_001274 [Rhodotorula mucilaginosa]TKA53362.1 hypothetical protein B0A53_04380 [Rhodotorula sp. CCFEE 5036]
MWRGTLSFNKYISVAARATRQALKEEQRLAAERRAAVTLKVQHWENGKAGPSEWIVKPDAEQH